MEQLIYEYKCKKCGKHTKWQEEEQRPDCKAYETDTPVAEIKIVENNDINIKHEVKFKCEYCKVENNFIKTKYKLNLYDYICKIKEVQDNMKKQLIVKSHCLYNHQYDLIIKQYEEIKENAESISKNGEYIITAFDNFYSKSIVDSNIKNYCEEYLNIFKKMSELFETFKYIVSKFPDDIQIKTKNLQFSNEIIESINSINVEFEKLYTEIDNFKENELNSYIKEYKPKGLYYELISLV